ncbi:oxidoreductase [Capronia epimyces CBS 606.96]|uniref:Oxidoreductase n=1 Tax=Capronia epimyces CBS 606.96 TaxID=1182542 RepID=W9Y6P2_9EURO|nr:oxidoreductase [Capronia epimyces CBS 606.96]EXJ84876.1 oxidoreductase [Capronia epimyces CBS 606.96]
MTSTKGADYDVIVVGAGFSGIRSLWEVDQIGLSVKCFEAGSDVGGTWYWNSYPGARTDSEAWVYRLNFLPEMKDEFNYHERYPSQQEVQGHLKHVVEHFNLRKYIQFDTRINSAQYSESQNIWTITTVDGKSTTCRYFLPATGPLSIPKDPPFAGLKSYTGEWYQAAKWPKKPIDFHGKRIAVIGTGATGVQIIPKIAPVAKQLTVFQRTPNYVLPGRNYIIDDHQLADIKQNHEATWNHARTNNSGLAMKLPGRTVQGVADPEKIRQVLDAGWEAGGFHFHFETFDDLFTNLDSNEVASEYIRQKIRAVVEDPATAELLCPRYPYLSKRPPCGHFYYEAFNRPNVKLVDISQDTIDLYEKGIRTSSGAEYEFDMIIFALGFDAGTGALSEMEVKNAQGELLRDRWAERLETFGGVLVPGFPNMFLICGPHVPFGNMPVVLDIQVQWIGKTLRHMEQHRLNKIDVSKDAVTKWSAQVEEAFKGTLLGESAKKAKAWFVGANIEGKADNVLFYFGGVPAWSSWLENESKTDWASMEFGSPTAAVTDEAEKPKLAPEAIPVAPVA